MYTEIDKIITEFSAADDSKKNQIADWLKVVKSYPDTELVKALFERETLRTKLAHKEEFVNDCDRIIKSQLKVIKNLSQKLEKLTLENEELKTALDLEVGLNNHQKSEITRLQGIVNVFSLGTDLLQTNNIEGD